MSPPCIPIPGSFGSLIPLGGPFPPSAACGPPSRGGCDEPRGPSEEFRFHSRWRWPCLLLPLPHLQLELQFEALAGLGAGREWEWEEGAGGSQRKPESGGPRGGAGWAGRPGTEPLGIAGSRGQEGIAAAGGSQRPAGTAGARRRWVDQGVPNLSPRPPSAEVSGCGASWELGTGRGTTRGVGTAGTSAG